MDVTVRSEIKLAPLSAADTIEKALRAIEARGVKVLTYSVGTDFQRGLDFEWSWETGIDDVIAGLIQEAGIPTATAQPITIKVRGDSTSKCKKAVHEGIASVSGWTDALRAWVGEIKTEVVIPTVKDLKKAAENSAFGFGVGLSVLAAVAAAYFLLPVLMARR